MVDDGQDGAVTEAVDEPSGAGPGGESGDEEFVVGDAASAEVVGEGGPAGRCVAGLVVRVTGEVDPEPFVQARLGPRAELQLVKVDGFNERDPPGSRHDLHTGLVQRGRPDPGQIRHAGEPVDVSHAGA